MEYFKACLVWAIIVAILLFGCTSQQQGNRASAIPATSEIAKVSINAVSNPTSAVPTAFQNPLVTSAVASLQNSIAGALEISPTPTPKEPVLEDHERFLLLIPDNLNYKKDSIVFVAFSPSGDANSEISVLKDPAAKRGWLVFASKTFHNGDLPEGFDAELISDLGNASGKLGYTNPKYVFTGFSGGGQLSQAFAFSHPKIVTAVVTNCGIINSGFWNFTKYYPHDKIALFLASPTDMRYEQMKIDRDFLNSIGWKTGWIEFSGGHALAPVETYEQAADWIEKEIGN